MQPETPVTSIRGNRWERRAVWLLGGCFLLLQLLFLPAYGLSWDEPTQLHWAGVLWRFLITPGATLPELPGYGQYYSPAIGMLTLGLAHVLSGGFGLPFVPVLHLPGVLFATCGLMLTIFLGKRLLGLRWGLAAGLFLALTPAFIAHAQVNQRDIALLAVTAGSFLGLESLRHRPCYASACLAGLCIGAAAAVKITGLLVLPVFLLSLLVLATQNVSIRPSVPVATLRRAMALIAMTGLAAAAGLVTLWPNLLREPSLFFETISFFLKGSFWSQSVSYLGIVYPTTELPWHYVPVHLLIGLPLPLLLCACVGIGRTGALIARRRADMGAVLPLVWLAVTLVVIGRPGTARYDGFRQALPALPAATMLASAGARTLWRACTRLRYGIIGPLLACGAILLTLAGIVQTHPYELSYVNEMGRLLLPHPLEEQTELDYWALSYPEAIEWINANARPDSRVCVPIADHLIAFLGLRRDLTLSCDSAQYLLLLTRFGMLPPPLRRIARSPVFTIQRFGADLARVYEF